MKVPKGRMKKMDDIYLLGYNYMFHRGVDPDFLEDYQLCWSVGMHMVLYAIYFFVLYQTYAKFIFI